jgi:predicted transcriptional regulator YdeE
MEPVIIARNEWKVAGIACRTTNEQEMKGDGEIPRLWERYFAERIVERIPNRMEHSPTFGVYTDYENGASGQYVLTIGAEVGSSDDLPANMLGITIPAARYAVFTTSRGPLSKVVPEAWSYIWQYFGNANVNMERAFTYDFEVYDERSLDPDNAQVDIYISIK